MRSILWIGAERPMALAEALASDADALLLALPDQPDPAVRQALTDFLRSAHLAPERPLLYVRLPSIEAATIDDDLAAAMTGEPDGIMLGHCRGAADVQHLGAKLAVHEANHDLTDGETAIIAEAGGTARSLFELGSYREASSRLLALAWRPEMLAADLGGEPSGPATASPIATARDLVLLAARAAEVSAIDGPSPDSEGALRAACEASRHDGFNAKLATSAAQVAIINAIFDRQG